MLTNQDVLVKCMQVIANMQWNNTKLFDRLPVKTRLPKQDHVWVLALHKLWQFFFGKTIKNRYCASMLLWKWFTILLRNLSCQSSYFQWKLTIGWFLGWNKNFQGLEQPHFLVLQLCHLILYSLLHPTFACLQATPGLEIWQVCAAPGLGRLSTLGWWGQCKYHTWRETYL